MQLLSVVIITFNEEEHIGRCIKSVKMLADEIIVLDSGSTDRTVSIARSHGAMIYQQPFQGYIEQKNNALQLATHNYVLSLDADEALDPVLINAILDIKKKFSYSAYSMNRCNNFCGRFLRHGLWYPDRKIRLFDKRIAKWGGLNPHDKITVSKNTPVKHLKGDILHYSINSLEDQVERNNRMSSIAAKSLFDTGRKSSWHKILIHPAWAFFNGYFFRLGFLDGFAGLSFAVNAAHQVFLKYCKLYRLQKSVSPKTRIPVKLLIAEKKSIANDS